MSEPLRSALAAAARLSPTEASAWRRYRDPRTGLSLELPFDLVAEASTPFETLATGRMSLPYVFDATFMTAPESVADDPRGMVREIATQWMVDYRLASAPRVRRIERPSVDEAWSVVAEIEDEAGAIGYAWHALRRGVRLGCVGLSCWSAEELGREALHRASLSIAGD